MDQITTNPNPRKRPAQDLELLMDEDTTADKRPCTDVLASSSHQALLEELCDLEGEDAEPCLEASARDSLTQEDLVAEMMKSLEKVIEEGESRFIAVTSSSHADFPSPASPAPTTTSALDFSWTYDEPLISQQPSFHGELDNERDLNEDAHIRQLLQASDDELGIPLSSSSSDLDESSFHEEWDSITNQSVSASFNWLDASFPPFEEAPSFSRDVFEPVILF